MDSDLINKYLLEYSDRSYLIYIRILKFLISIVGINLWLTVPVNVIIKMRTQTVKRKDRDMKYALTLTKYKPFFLHFIIYYGYGPRINIILAYRIR